MPKTDTRKTPVRYAPNTPPPESGYQPVGTTSLEMADLLAVGKSSLVMADLLARVFGLEKPVIKFEPVNLEDL